MMSGSTYNEVLFRRQVLAALASARTALAAQRKPTYLDDSTPHEYSDKFAVAELMANTAVAASTNVWNVLGLGPDHQRTVLEWHHKKGLPVTLRFIAQDTCTFLKVVDLEVPNPEGDVKVSTKTEKSGLLGLHRQNNQTETITVTRTIKEYHWRVGIEHQLIIFPGNLSKEGIILQSRKTETVLITQQQSLTPLPESTLHGAVDVSLTWFLQQIDPTEQSCKFSIERDSDKTKTPRRNEQVDEAIKAHQELKEWSRLTQGFFLQRVEREIMGKDNPAVPRSMRRPGDMMEPGHTGVIQGLSKEPTLNGHRVRIISYEGGRYKAEPIDAKSGLPPTLAIKPENIKPDDESLNNIPLAKITDEMVLIPILPLMEKDSVMTDVSEFLQEQARSLDEALDGLSRMYPSRQLVKLVSVAEASLVLICKHLERLCRMLSDGMDHVENMLQKQLISAVGKHVSAADFNNFMKFHYPRLLGPMYAPVPFCRAIRQVGHFPDGIIAIEKDGEPISTWMRAVPGVHAPPIRIPIHAAASVEITGDRFLHGWMTYNFASEPPPQPLLACRARQFSSFLVVLGTIAGPDSFEPKEAIILQNKDEVLIPLILTTLPSAKVFRDSIHSLSPEQQEFAKAFRGMQLSSSVFGVCVIQLKPQLEKLLELPSGSLTKEIKLTQELMSLFVDYQIPSDMLTYDGAAESPASEKLAAVKGHVKSVMDVIAGSKKQQLKEEAMKADMRTEVGHKKQTRTEECYEDEFDFEEQCLNLQEASCAVNVPERKKMRKSVPWRGSRCSESHRLACKAAIQPGSVLRVISTVPPPQKVQSTVKSSAETGPEPTLQELSPTDDGKQNMPESDLYAGNQMTHLGTEDFTLIPKILDAKLEEFDSDGALRSTTIKASDRWIRSRQENLLLKPTSSALTQDDIVREKKRAFDLLDCISRSGALPIACSELHVFVAVSHFFEKECIQTIVQDNVNPIAKVERSALILASTTFGVPAQNLIKNEQDTGRLGASFPRLFSLEDNSSASPAHNDCLPHQTDLIIDTPSTPATTTTSNLTTTPPLLRFFGT